MNLIKDIYFGKTSREKLIAGIDKLAEAVKVTLGAGGRNVVIADGFGMPHSTKDGVTVANSIKLEDPVEDLGVSMIKQASQKTATKAGDGTTTSTILAQELVHKALEAIEENPNDFRKIKEGILSATEKVIACLEDMSIPVTDELLERVAVISSNNDEVLGGLIAEAFKKVGEDGSVIMERNFKGPETYVEYVEGTKIDRPLKNHYFMTDLKREEAVLENPLVFLSLEEVPNFRRIEKIVGYAAQHNRPILMITDMAAQPLHTVLTNKVKGKLSVNVIDAPLFGNKRNEVMEDLAFLTGATLINEKLGDDFDLISPDCLGTAKRAVSNKEYTVLTFDEMRPEAAERVQELKDQLVGETDPWFKQNIVDRLAALSGSIGVIKVGANSEVELKEKEDRVDDAIHATRAATKEGILPGGGVALYDAHLCLNDIVDTGGRVLLETILTPWEQILDNAGLPNEFSPFKKEGIGTDAKTGEEVNMVEAGIIDPLLVTKSALKNAVSVATTIISTDAVVSNKVELNEG